jgi:hypothetical protein
VDTHSYTFAGEEDAVVSAHFFGQGLLYRLTHCNLLHGDSPFLNVDVVQSFEGIRQGAFLRKANGVFYNYGYRIFKAVISSLVMTPNESSSFSIF